jgi:photosystem II stability/assembly factor-like uncharacterized protein
LTFLKRGGWALQLPLSFAWLAALALPGGLGLPDRAAAHTPHDDIYDIALSPTHDEDETLFIIVRGNLMKSEDAGATWRRLIRGLDHTHRLISLSTAGRSLGTLFVSSRGDGVYRSRDAGRSWMPVNSGLHTLNIERVHGSLESSDLVLAAGAEGGLHLTEDGGKSWALVLDMDTRITSLALFPGRPHQVAAGDDAGVLHVSRDAGIHWRSLPLEGAGPITALAVSPTFVDDGVIVAGTRDGQVFRSTNHGGSFSRAGQAWPSAVASLLLIAGVVSGEDAGPRTLVSLEYDGLFASPDGGATWARTGRGLTAHPQARRVERPFYSVLSAGTAPGGARVLLLAGYNGLFRSTDDGQSWRELPTLSDNAVMGLGVSPAFAQDRTIAITTYLWGAFLSRDAGHTWSPINRGADDYVRPNGRTRLFDIPFSPDYPSDHTLYTGTWYRFLKSTNEGRSWRQILPANEPWWLDSYHGLTIAFAPAESDDRTLFLGTTRGHVFRSTDRGETFSLQGEVDRPVASLLVSPDVGADKTLFAGVTNGIRKSEDLGRTWSPADTGIEWLEPLYHRAAGVKLAMSPAYREDGVLFAGTAAGLYRTRDRGGEWERLPGDAYGGDAFVEAVVVSPEYLHDRTLLVSVRGHGLFKSEDGGDTFIATGTELIENNYLLANLYGFPLATSVPLRFSPTYAEDRTVFGYADTQIFRSQDAGATWTVLDIPRPDWRARGYLLFRRWYKSKKLLGATALALLLAGGLVFALVRSRRRVGPGEFSTSGE